MSKLAVLARVLSMANTAKIMFSDVNPYFSAANVSNLIISNVKYYFYLANVGKQDRLAFSLLFQHNNEITDIKELN